MELKALKREWNEKSNRARYSRPELEEIFELRTKDSLKVLNRNMFTDAIFMIIATTIFITISFTMGLKDRFWISAELLCLATVLIIHYRIKYLSVNRYNFDAQGIRTVLQSVIHRLKWYLGLYKLILPAISATLYVTYLFQVQYYRLGNYNIEHIALWKWILILPLLLIIYLATVYLSNFIYGKGVRRLEHALRQLNLQEG